MSLKGKLEAIIYAAEEPVTVDQMAVLLRHDVLTELAATAASTASESESEANRPEAAAEDQSATDPTVEATIETTGESSDENGPVPASKKKLKDPELTAVKARLREVLAEFVQDYQTDTRGVEIRQVAGGYRMATKPEHHDLVVGFAKSLKPPIRLSLQALETLAVVAYKQPVTAPEVSEIRGVDASGVIATLLDRKLVTTAGRKQVIGRPILYKTTKEFLMRFGLKDVNELPSMEEFEKLGEAGQGVLLEADEQPVQPSPETVAAEQSASEVEARNDDALMASEEHTVAHQDETVRDVAEAAEAISASQEAEPSAAEIPSEDPDEANVASGDQGSRRKNA